MNCEKPDPKPRLPLEAEVLIALQAELVDLWAQTSHSRDSLPACDHDSAADILRTHMIANHGHNFRLWQLEDGVRDLEAPDAEIVNLKRQIDRENQLRHNACERFDECLLQFLQDLEVHHSDLDKATFSESPGAILDRTSILNLKKYYMKKRAHDSSNPLEVRTLSEKNLANLELQLRDLTACLKEICLSLAKGERRLTIYYQFKMYNDPKPTP